MSSDSDNGQDTGRSSRQRFEQLFDNGNGKPKSQEQGQITPERETPITAPRKGTPTAPRRWSDHLPTVFTSEAKGFKLKEDGHQFVRIFEFRDEPNDYWKMRLQRAGFAQRPTSGQWTIRATPEGRELSDKLALEFAGKEQAKWHR